jgi:hypothetical protein
MPVGSAKFGLFAAAGGGEVFGWEWISKVEVASDNSAILFDDGPWPDYQALRVVASIRGSYASESATVYFKMGHGASPTYENHNLIEWGNHASNSTHQASYLNSTWGAFGIAWGDSADQTDFFSPLVMEVFNPNDTVYWKNYAIFTGYTANKSATANSHRHQHEWGVAEFTEAIGSLYFASNAGFETGCRADLYGLKMDSSKVTDN